MGLFTVNEIKFVLGTVTMSSPQWGLMLVADKTQTIEKAAKPFIAYMNMSPNDFGAGVRYAYPPGTDVLCALSPNSDNVGYVICAVNDITKDYSIGNIQWRGYLPRNIRNVNYCQKTAVGLLVNPFAKNYVNNRSTSIDPGQYPGDFVVSDNEGAVGMSISRMIMQLKASALTYMELSAADNRITVMADKILSNTPLVEVFNENGLYGHNTAMVLYEALGLDEVTGSGLVSEDGNMLADQLQTKGSDDYELKYKTLPFFRMQSIEGYPVQGRESLITWLDGEQMHTPDTQPIVLSRRRDSLSGELSSASAFGITSIKSPNIKGILQRGYGHSVTSPYKASDGRAPSLRVPYTVDTGDFASGAGKAPDLDELNRDIPLNAFIHRDPLGSGGQAESPAQGIQGKINAPEAFYSDKNAKSSQAQDGVMAAEKTLYSDKMQGNGNLKEMQAPYGSVHTESYPLPSMLTLTDPVTGETRHYYATESFISQEPNGDILLSDGYGSEIRMSRGNIYISPALDCIVRSGRDTTVMAGRYQTYNSQNTCTISTVNDLYIKASKDLKIAGAMSQRNKTNNYAVTLESGAEYGSTGGVVIRSNSGLSLTSNDIYIGRNSNNGTSKDSVTYPENPGSIIIDAGRENGTFSVNSRENLIYGERNTLLSESESGGNGALVSAGGIWMIMGTLLECPMSIAVGPVKTERMEYKIDVPKAFNEAGQVTINTFRGDYGFIVNLDGHIQMTGNVMANGQGLFRRGVYAWQVASTSRSRLMGYIKPENRRIWDPWVYPDRNAVEGMGTYVKALVDGMSVTIYNDDFISGKGFYFPDYNVPAQITIPGMRWQYMEQESENQVGEQGRWHEEFIPMPNNESEMTACYPGYDVWNEALISIPGWETASLFSDYVINTTDEENGTDENMNG